MVKNELLIMECQNINIIIVNKQIRPINSVDYNQNQNIAIKKPFLALCNRKKSKNLLN